MSKNLMHRVVVLLLLVTFTAGAAQAAPWSFGEAEVSPVTALWEWIGSWFEPERPAAVWTEGCGMDPNGGGCHQGSGNPGGSTGDGGAGVNPNG